MTGSGGGGRLEEVVDDGILLLLSNSEGKYIDSKDIIDHRITKNRGNFTEEVHGMAGAGILV